MVVVIAIIGIIAVFAIPAASTIIRGSQLSLASQTLTDQISLARQYALTKNRSIEVRFYRFGDPEAPGEKADDPSTGQFRALQIFEVFEGGAPLPIGQVQRLPATTMINCQQLSTLLDVTSGTGSQSPQKPSDQDPDLPRGVKKNYEYCSFRFRPDGSTNLLPTKTWYATVHLITDNVTSDTPPPNFFTLQIDPVAGTIKSYRPSAG
jgi:uncharacterized protein (TIGR02596 family)